MFKGAVIRILVEDFGVDKLLAARVVNVSSKDLKRLYKENHNAQEIASHIAKNLNSTI